MTSFMKGIRDEFLSEEDLDLATLTMEELERVWQEWLKQAQVSNDLGAWVYSHGVFAGADLRELFPHLADSLATKKNTWVQNQADHRSFLGGRSALPVVRFSLPNQF